VSFEHLGLPGLTLAVFFVSFAESLAVVGLLVPGVALLMSLTILAVDAGVPPALWWGAGTVGAFLGDGVSFWLGQRSGPRVRNWRYFQRHPRLLSDGERFFYRFGIWSIMLGRFVGPIRPVIPLAAGALAMPARRFWLANLVSSPVWGAVYLLGMYWLGEAFMDYLSPGAMFGLLAGATAIAVVVSLLVRGRHSV